MAESFPLQPLDFCFFEVELSASTIVVGVGHAGDEGRGKVGRQAEGRHCFEWERLDNGNVFSFATKELYIPTFVPIKSPMC